MERCYIYIHTRLDTQEVFYVGRGTVGKRVSGKCDTNTYKRAYVKHLANKYWMNITNSIPWEVIIVHDYLTWDESIELEKKYIKEYGRKDLGVGTLINFTDGGEGSRGAIASDYSKEIQRVRMSGENNPNKRPESRWKQSIRMKENNPMKNKETALKVVAAKAEAWANGRPNPLKGKPREDVRQNNLLNNPAKKPEAREKIKQARAKRDMKGGNSPVAKKVLDTRTGLEYNSIIECAAGIGKTTVTVFNYIKKGIIQYVLI